MVHWVGAGLISSIESVSSRRPDGAGMGCGEEGPILSLLLGEPAIVCDLRHSIYLIHCPAGAVTTTSRPVLFWDTCAWTGGWDLLPRLGWLGMCFLSARNQRA